MDDFKYQELKKLDGDMQKELVKKYLELTKHKKFDVDDFESWLDTHLAIDDRPEGNNIE